ncbi:putative phosphoketolase [Nocardia neocaledoniensis NBRC 108232]|uniref:Probable phosphoketolase n=1 Tax=Nocardia neocaledoniensis TaxID=236511 RepID=A0A317NCC9_9NOCA|nr:phosphoketolase family protein [Nocardia neocaledoniensis]PWV72849.1 xylulose-5-phosphate/fructose-6-phosphate phosphoketolase [Nocardia neocaledoniensis]GEM32781.1 putative phosphoketolase [Nocardia neocaledoniensis NBRC 108232]
MTSDLERDTAADTVGGGEGETVAPEPYVLTEAPGPLTRPELVAVDTWWRAANYLAVGQIYLLRNPLLREPLRAEDVKPRLLGHFGTVPGLNLVWAHANRVIRDRGLHAVFVAGPGHGGPGPNACAWLEGAYAELYRDIPRDEAGMRRLFHQFSFPGGVPSHCAPETPGSFHEGGELGYSLLHAYGAALDNPDLTVFCVIGDGEAETGPLAGSWHANKFLNAGRDGAVVPILALNEYKIANPTIFARIPEAELVELLRGYGYQPIVVSGSDPAQVHQDMAAAMDSCLAQIARFQRAAREDGDTSRPRWPMIVLHTPKGWTCPPVVDGERVEGTFRAHQVPLPAARTNPEHRRVLEQWLRSYRPEELFDETGAPVPELLAQIPERPMSLDPVANGGLLVRDLDLPDWREYGVEVERPGAGTHEATRVLGGWLRDVTARNPGNFLTFAPDELVSNRLQDILEVTGRDWQAEVGRWDVALSTSGRAVEVLSEHMCQGLLEGYLLTGRHGVFTCYEAFIHIVDAMFNQHAKWLDASLAVPWRRRIPSLNYLLTSHVWRQDHNGFTHQDPGFLDVVTNKSPEIVRVYLPPDANTLLSTYDHCLRSLHYANVVVAGKQPGPDWLSVPEAALHCARGVGIWEWACHNDDLGSTPDVVLACAGDIPTLETLAAAAILRDRLPELRVRVINVVDLMRLLPAEEHPHGLSDAHFDTLFTTDAPVIFAFHGYPWLVHRLTYRRANHANLHVRGYKEKGTTTTPFDMVMLNDLDRFHLVLDVIDRVPGLGARAAGLRQEMVDARLTARRWTREHGEDIPVVADWVWPEAAIPTVP